MKGYSYSHKRVYRIYLELELNLRIKPKRYLIREKPDEREVPRQINAMWSVNFMYDSLLMDAASVLSMLLVATTEKDWRSR